MTHGSLFSGIGGFDLAAEWMGWENLFHCEWSEFNQKILKKHWPNAKQYTNIINSDFTVFRGKIGILTGGFPCQPFSAAGERKGTEDERHLWPEMLRAIREIQPTYVVGENVSGLINWSGGLVFEMVQADLEAEGYKILPFILPACAVNAPHRRDRVWFIAYAESKRLETENKRSCKELALFKETSMGNDRCFTTEWINRCPDPGTIRVNDGIPNWMDRIKSYGNAIVPQVAYKIFQSIEQYENIITQ